ncbi:MAG: hypothetical protein ABL974_19760, partial [Prosthecobacter sp.]
MKKVFLGFLAALFLHAFVFLFGGFLIPKGEKEGPKKDVLQEVEIAKEEKPTLREFFLLSSKPTLFACNVAEEEL